MPSQVQHLSPEMYRRLLILDPPPPKRRVSFSDLNEVRQYSQNEPPVQISKRPEVEVLRERVKRLERRLEKLTYKPTTQQRDKENMNTGLNITSKQPREMILPPVPPWTPVSLPNTPGSAHSVTSPYQPVSGTRATQPSRPRSSSRHTEQQPMPAHLHRAIKASSAVPPTPANTQVPVQRPVQQQPQQPIPSKAKRFVLALGALCVTATIPALIGGLIALGPAGLGVAAGVALLGMSVIYLGNRMK